MDEFVKRITQGAKNTATDIGKGLYDITSTPAKRVLQGVKNTGAKVGKGIYDLTNTPANNPTVGQMASTSPETQPSPKILVENAPPLKPSYSMTKQLSQNSTNSVPETFDLKTKKLTYPPDTKEYEFANPAPDQQSWFPWLGFKDATGNHVSGGTNPYVSADYHSSSTGPYEGQYVIQNNTPLGADGQPSWIKGGNVFDFNANDPNLQSSVTPGLNYLNEANLHPAPLNNPPSRLNQVNKERADDIEKYLQTQPNYPGKTGDIPGRSVFKLKPQPKATTTPEATVSKARESNKPLRQASAGTINGKLV